MLPSVPPAWWSLPADELLRSLHTGASGLGAKEAARRLRSFGANRIAVPARRRLWHEIARRLRNPLLLVLLAAGVFSASTGEGASAGIIAAVIVLSIGLDHLQEKHAEDAAARLGARVALTALVLRDGQARRVHVADVVPGDIVRLSAGVQVPADGMLLESQDLFVQESALTGESFPVEKSAHPQAKPGENSPNVLFMGSNVISGTGTFVACRTGTQTRMGEVADAVRGWREDLAFENDLRAFGLFVTRITMLLVLFVVLVGGALHRPWLESLLFALALAVGLTPELLPMVVTVSLARGALRLAKEHVIVKRMSAIHNLGSMDVLCTDKTGTLTEAKISLVRSVDLHGEDSQAVLENALLNSHFESGIRTPLEDAVLAHGGGDMAGWTKIDEVPFDFERRRLSVLVENKGERRLCVKGAAPDVMRQCDRWLDATGEHAWDARAKSDAQATLDALEAGGFRVLGVAYKQVPVTESKASVASEAHLVFAGFAVFVDPPKADAAASLRELHAQGVAVKIVTGDSELVTRHVCDALGMPVQGVLLGADIARMDDRALAQRVRRANLFCRVDPIQKNRVIRALRNGGHVVGYLGDGINDAPALHSADVGISVDKAAETARASADLILLRHHLSVLSAAVTEGRRTFANTRKYILLGTSSAFGNMTSMAAASVFLPFLPMLPVQILLNNLLYDFVSAALPLDRVDPRDSAGPQAWDMQLVRRFMFVFGPVSSIFDGLTFAMLLVPLHASPAQFQTGWFVESLCTQVLAVFVIRTRGPALEGRPDRALVAASAAVLAMAIGLPLTPVGTAFGLVPLPGIFYTAIAGMTCLYLLLLEGVKRRFYAVPDRRRHPH